MLLTALIFLLLLSILVFVHEFGHFISAKKLGIGVEEFGFGLPPRLFGVKRGETLYSINLLLIGGFVKLYGEDQDTSDGGEATTSTPRAAGKAFGDARPRWMKKAFFAKPKKVRAAVLLSGVAMNFVLAVAVFSFLFTRGVMVPTDRVHIEKVAEGSPAAVAGLKEGDTIKKLKMTKGTDRHSGEPSDSEGDSRIDSGQDPGQARTTARMTVQKLEETQIKSAEQLINFTKDHLGEEIILEIERCEKGVQCSRFDSARRAVLSVKLTPRKEYPGGEGPMGIVISNYEERTYPWYQAPFLGTKEAFSLSWLLFKGIAQTLWKLISFQPVGKEVAGPVGIAQLTGEAVKFGKMAILELLGLLSLNLAVINILPFPALDGGRLLFVGIEALTGRKVRPKWERWTHQVGMAILLAFFVLITINDILRIIGK